MDIKRPAPFTRLKDGFAFCRVNEIADPGSREFLFEGKDEVLSIFLVRKGEHISAFVNNCPHANRRLNFQPHDFLTEDKSEIICHGHGAVFDLKDGVCTQGPCLNFALQQVPIRIEQGIVVSHKPASNDS